MKQSLQWHKEAQATTRDFLAEKKKALVLHVKQERQAIEKTERELAKRAAQIQEAEKRGLDGFDEDRFLPRWTPLDQATCQALVFREGAPEPYDHTCGNKARYLWKNFQGALVPLCSSHIVGKDQENITPIKKT